MATTATDHGDVLLVGSFGRVDDDWTVEDVFRRSAAALGGHVSMIPDGELGDRSQWITWIARHTYHGHPDLETRSRHTFEDWMPKSYDDQWRFGVRDGVERIRFEKIGYADEAKRSYEIFTRLRDEGVIPQGVRLLVAYPLTESAVRAFVNEPRSYEIIWEAYNDAVRRELEDLGRSIPPEDLAIQWDLSRETAMIENVAFNFDDAGLTRVPQDPMERYLQALAEVSPSVPDGAWLGLHVCYGSLQHKEGESPDSAHYTPIRDLGTAVEMLNRGVVACGRRVDFVHMPVQLADQRDGHYAPLDDLAVGDARVYLGLIDLSDGVEGALKRIALAKAHLADFGVATPCGWGRRPKSQRIGDLLKLDAEVAAARAT
jgi:methionine synthase II (cobalamin-independent)